MTSLQEFAREAELQYRRLAELAESAGAPLAADALRDKAARMHSLLEEGETAELAGPTFEVHVVLTELQSHLNRVLESWPPDDLGAAVDEVLASADRLSRLGSAEPQRPRSRARSRWAAKEPPPTKDPPSFPGPKGRPKK